MTSDGPGTYDAICHQHPRLSTTKSHRSGCRPFSLCPICDSCRLRDRHSAALGRSLHFFIERASAKWTLSRPAANGLGPKRPATRGRQHETGNAVSRQVAACFGFPKPQPLSGRQLPRPLRMISPLAAKPFLSFDGTGEACGWTGLSGAMLFRDSAIRVAQKGRAQLDGPGPGRSSRSAVAFSFSGGGFPCRGGHDPTKTRKGIFENAFPLHCFLSLSPPPPAPLVPTQALPA